MYGYIAKCIYKELHAQKLVFKGKIKNFFDWVSITLIRRREETLKENLLSKLIERYLSRQLCFFLDSIASSVSINYRKKIILFICCFGLHYYLTTPIRWKSAKSPNKPLVSHYSSKRRFLHFCGIAL